MWVSGRNAIVDARWAGRGITVWKIQGWEENVEIEILNLEIVRI